MAATRKSIKYSEWELDYLYRNRKKRRSDLHAEFVQLFKRSDVSLDSIKSLMTRKRWKGTSSRFQKGHVPKNKGKKGKSTPGMVATQFKKGIIPANSVPLWHERVNVYGYIEIKIPEPNPYTKAKTRFVAKHKYLWEKKNGPVPEGHRLKSLDGDKTNTDPSNWIPLPFSVFPRLNGIYGRDYDSAPAELKPAILRTALLAQAATDAKKGKK